VIDDLQRTPTYNVVRHRDCKSVSSRGVTTGRRLAKNTAINGGAAVVNTLIALISTSLLLSGWGSSKFGLWALLLMMTFDRGLMALFDLGHGTAALQLLATGDSAQKSGVFRKLRIRYLMFSLVGALSLLTLGHFLISRVADVESSENFWILTALMSARLPIDMRHSTNLIFLESQNRYATIRAIEVCANLIWLLTLFVVVDSDVSIQLVALLYFFHGVLQLVASSYLLCGRRDGTCESQEVDEFVTIDLWANGRWVALQRVLSIIYSNMDRVIISAVVGLSGLGEYEIPYKIQAFGVLILSVLPSAVFPVAARMKSQLESVQLSVLFVRASRLTVAMCVPPLLAIVMLAETLVVNWVGKQYRELADSVRLFSSWTFLGVFHVIGATMLSAIGRNKEIFLIFLSSIAVNLPASIVLGVQFGVNGVILGTVLSYVVSFGPYLVVELRVFDVSFKEWFIGILSPIVIPVALEFVVLFAGLHWIGVEMSLIKTMFVGMLSTIVGWVTYILLFAQKEDLKMIRSIPRRD